MSTPDAATPARGARAPALAVLCASLASLGPTWAHMPIPLYDPIGRAWRLARIGADGAPRIEMSYYGIYLCAALGGLLGAGLGLVLESRSQHSPSEGLLPMWALCGLGLAAAYQAFSLLL